MHLPQQYILQAIHNPLLFQQNNPLISQSMSLLNSRHQKSHQHSADMQEWTSKELSGRLGKKYNEIKIQNRNNQEQDQQDQSSCQEKYHHQNCHQNEQMDENDQIENIRAIKQFQRQIEEKFKISVSNKLYTFPRLKITSIMDIISSSESDEEQEQQNQSKETSQLTENQFSPFNPKHYQPNFKTQYFQDNQPNLKSTHNYNQDRNFKKVKISTKKDKEKQRKNTSLKKQDLYSHRQKPKHTKKNPQVSVKQKDKQKSKSHINRARQKETQRPSNTKAQQPWAVKQPHQILKRNYAERLKTEMKNESSGMSESITQSKRRFYEEEFVLKR